MAQSPEEWLKQADYDMDTAQAMFDTSRHFYAVFMCHLSLEKALKGLYWARLKKIPPKTHSLVWLSEQLRLAPAKEHADFFYLLNRLSVTTRYPEDIGKLQQEFSESRTRNLLIEGKDALRWLKSELPRS